MACEYLLLNGVPIDAVDDLGYSALHMSTERGFIAQVYLLLKHKAKYDIEANDGKKPLDIAVEQRNADIVTLLVGFQFLNYISYIIFYKEMINDFLSIYKNKSLYIYI